MVLPLMGPAQTKKKTSIESLKKEQTALKKRINNNEKLLKNTKTNVKKQLNNLVILNGQITVKQRQVNGIAVRVDSLRGNIQTLTSQVRQLERELAECKRKYRRGVLSVQRDKMMNNKLMFLFSARNFHSMYLRMRYMSEFTRYQRVQGEIVKEKELALQAKRDELNVKKGEQEVLLAQGRSEQQALEGQKAERQKVVAGLQQKQKELNKTLEADRVRARNLDAKIDQLIKAEIAAAEKRRKAEAEKRRREAEAQASKGKSRASGKSGGSSSKFIEPADPDRKLSDSFVANKGRLPMPITGSYYISSHFGANTVEGLSGVTIPNSGISITGKPGAQAKCIFNGEVTAVFSYGGKINVIVRHGSYLSVYCDLSSASVRNGQKVTTGQIIGNIAKDASGNCTLQFQIRKETTKLNPAAWVR